MSYVVARIRADDENREMKDYEFVACFTGYSEAVARMIEEEASVTGYVYNVFGYEIWQDRFNL
jgi:hypothetical protein